MQNDITPPSNWRPPKTNKQKAKPRLDRASLKKALRATPAPIDVHEPEITITEDLAAQKPKRRYHHWSRRRKVLVVFACLLVVAGAGFGTYLTVFYKKPALVIAKPAIVKAEPPAPKTVASPLTGLQVDPSLAARPVTAVMIENSLDARPQSGLQDAGVVFEAIAEAGITRFMGLFQDAQPQYLGPVRSLRPYYIDFAAPFQASIAHVGGSPDALAQVRSGAYRDIDQFFNGKYYWRASSRDAPHNVYTSFQSLDALNNSKGYASSQFTPWTRKAEKPLVNKTAAHINVHMSGPNYDSHYDYDVKTNSYLRAEGGAAHFEVVDAAGKNVVQIHPKVVITIATDYSLLSDGYHSNYRMTGGGDCYIFQDGGVSSCTWTKNDRTSMFSFADSAGAGIPLDAGQIWVAAVTSLGDVSSSP